MAAVNDSLHDAPNDAPNDAPKYTNRLIGETSPYLLQHAHNPVNWYPWGEEALAAARERDVPIFLSIGYAACHWCHVMERESFEDEDTSADLNTWFVPIKVDREERPDIDSVYMDALQALTGQGGWPMSMFLTPEGLPFYGGTYFPDRPRHGIPAFRELLARLAQIWSDRREQIESTAATLTDHVRDEQDAPARLLQALAELPEVDPTERLDDATRALAKDFDAANGGWGSAPKVPQAMSIDLLLREHLRTGATDPRLIAERSLEAMAAGGIYDHLGGGFARYSTDARWLVPHFEKMLYDNALLARVYAHAAQLSGDPARAYFARETLDFVAHEMRNPPAGAFAASLDADTEGVEGATYTWDASEIREVLGEAAPLFEQAYGVTEAGNWEGRTILERVASDTQLALEHERPRDEIAEDLARARTDLLRVRDERPQPGRHDKVLASWNGLMIGAFADVGQALSESSFVRIATEAADFVLAEMTEEKAVEDQPLAYEPPADAAAENQVTEQEPPADAAAEPRLRVRRSWKDGQARHAGTLEDHAHLAEGLLTLYETTFDERYFVAARGLAEAILVHFEAPEGGFFDTADDAETLIARPRNLQDNAVPAGGSMATLVLLRLAALTGESRYRDAAERALAPIVGIAAQHPLGFANWLTAYQLASISIDEIAIVGHPEAEDTKALLKVVREGYRPNQVVAVAPDAAASVVPLLRDRDRLDGAATAYLCRGFACRRPTSDPAELAAQLAEARSS